MFNKKNNLFSFIVLLLSIMHSVANASVVQTVINDNVAHLDLVGDAKIEIKPTAEISSLKMHDTSEVTIYGGDVSFLHLFDNSKATVYSGEVSWLIGRDNSHVKIYKGDISWLLLNPTAKATIYGTDFSYSNGHLSGKWANGESFSFWALIQIGDISNPNEITNILPHNITLSEVPLPAPLFLFLSGLLGLISIKQKH